MIVFERPGPVNTDKVIEAAISAAPKCDAIVVASVTGASAVKIAQKIKDKKIACVTCPQGMHWEVNKMDAGPFATIPELKAIRDTWRHEGLSRVPIDVESHNRELLGKCGVTIIKGTIPFFGPTFSMRLHLHLTTPLDIVAKTLEMISTGTLVCLECVLMAVDAGVIPEGSRVLAMAGTERGLDTAWIIRSSASANLFHHEKGARFIELLAKPGISEVPQIAVEYLR